MKSIRVMLLAGAFATALPFMAQANVLYKSVDANGVVMFSDMPPPSGARIIEQREFNKPGDYSASNGHAASHGAPSYSQPEPVHGEPMLNSDAILARANAQLDEAERGLAEARRVRGPINGAVRLASTNGPTVDDHLIEEHKRNVKMARQRLLEILRDRRVALASTRQQ